MTATRENTLVIITSILAVVGILIFSYMLATGIPKNKDSTSWCTTRHPYSVLTGKITEVSEEYHRIVVKRYDNLRETEVLHDADLSLEVGQSVSVTYGGPNVIIEDVSPQRITAICMTVTDN